MEKNEGNKTADGDRYNGKSAQREQAATDAYLSYTSIETIYADGGYRKTFIKETVKYLNVGVEKLFAAE